jgi:hypothetical protein
VLYYLRQEGLIAFGPDRQVDKAKPKKTYWITRLGTEHYLTEGKMESIDSVAVLQMASAEEDNGEACLDSAAASHNGDELAHAWAHTPAATDPEDLARIDAALRDDRDYDDPIDTDILGIDRIARVAIEVDLLCLQSSIKSISHKEAVRLLKSGLTQAERMNAYRAWEDISDQVSELLEKYA